MGVLRNEGAAKVGVSGVDAFAPSRVCGAAGVAPHIDPGLDILIAASVAQVSAALVAALRGDGADDAMVAWIDSDGIHYLPAVTADCPAVLRLQMALSGGLPERVPGVHRLCADAPASCVATLEASDRPVEPSANAQRWLSLAGVRIRELLVAQRAEASLRELARAQQLQRALLDIADMTGCQRDMPSLLKGLHDIIGRLMYADNIYIVMCDRARQSLRFIYFVDTEEMGGPTPAEDVPFEQLKGGLTWYLVHDAKPLRGSMDALRAQVSGPLTTLGPDSRDWLGVPMLRDGEAVGALVVQSYKDGGLYTQSDCEVLAFVAGHVLNALERKQRQEDLECRVRDRTSELAQSNERLRREVLQRMRGEHLQSTLYQIAALSNTDDGAESFYRQVHRAVGELINAENFYIALLSEDGLTLEFPYRIDTSHQPRRARPVGRGLSEYVMQQGKHVLVDRAGIARLVADGGIERPKPPVAVSWLGAPLLGSNGVMGVVAVQSHRADLTYDADDAALLTFVSHQIASSLQRRNHAEARELMNAQLEQRVQQRTQELREQIKVRKQIEAKLKHQVMHDPLTGLPNRLYLHERLKQSFARLDENPDYRIAVMYLDVDRFKLFNDNLGHLAGDEVLREVGRRLLGSVREPDVVARLSGDEFAILLDDAASEQTAVRVAERVLACLDVPMRIGNRDLQLSASIGVATSRPRHRSTDELLQDADVALYRAKSAGRKRYVLFDDSLQRTATNVFEIEQDLRRALNVGQFEPFFQPLVRLTTGQTVGYEALIRWNHPQRGMLLPGQFLSVAEDSGLMETIDWEMFRLACAAGRDLVRDGGYMTLNISPRHFQDARFGERLLGLLKLTSFNPSRLRIEVTENTLLGDPEAVSAILSQLKAAGVEAALDDFGTGYSSLSYVNEFPMRMIKIDRSFITTLGSDNAQRSSAIVSAILALSNTLGVEVLGEGIETQAQRQALIEMGCEYGQGFLFARPQPASHWVQPVGRADSASRNGWTSAD